MMLRVWTTQSSEALCLYLEFNRRNNDVLFHHCAAAYARWVASSLVEIDISWSTRRALHLSCCSCFLLFSKVEKSLSSCHWIAEKLNVNPLLNIEHNPKSTGTGGLIWSQVSGGSYRAAHTSVPYRVQRTTRNRAQKPQSKSRIYRHFSRI